MIVTRRSLARSSFSLRSCFLASGSPSAGVGQLVARASYVDDGSFALSSSTSEAPREPVALATDSQRRIHIADRQGSVYVFARDGSFEGSYATAALERPLSAHGIPSHRGAQQDRPEQSCPPMKEGAGELVTGLCAGVQTVWAARSLVPRLGGGYEPGPSLPSSNAKDPTARFWAMVLLGYSGLAVATLIQLCVGLYAPRRNRDSAGVGGEGSSASIREN